MITANEYTFTQSMIDEGIDIETIKNLRRKFKGWRIYFRSKKSEYDDIRADYEEMLETGYSEKVVIVALSKYYNLSIGRVREICRKQRGLFDEI